MRTFIICLILIFCGLAVGCGISGHYVQSTGSMIPAIGIGDHVGTFEIKNNELNPIERFDIVVYQSQPAKIKVDFDEKNTVFVHRVIGLPNEKIEIKKGKVFINDKLLGEAFQKIGGDSDFPAIIIPENEYFLLGDNRPNSLDSRYWKKSTINREDIRGKVETIIRKEDWDNGKRW